MTNKYDKAHMPFGSAFSIADPNVLKLYTQDVNTAIAISDETVQSKFLNEYQAWIMATKNNCVIGLDEYKYACYSNGTTEAFDKFYAKHSKKRFRFFKGEFVYHRLSCRNNNYDWNYIEDDKLDSNDVVIISLPFSDTGNAHESLHTVLTTCEELKIPVLLDCAYFGICNDITFDLRYKCITDVTFSLSKSLYAAHLRIGMRLTREDDDDPLFVTNKIGYINRTSAYIGRMLLRNFSPDYIYNKYRDRQIKYCNILNVEPSNCVIFGIGDDRWNDYNRERETNRLSLHKYLVNDCSKEIKNEQR
jgi:histidinol-phosphate/aromatic aminotransferase/cobyric acid decarboxylase-like protein